MRGIDELLAAMALFSMAMAALGVIALAAPVVARYPRWLIGASTLVIWGVGVFALVAYWGYRYRVERFGEP